MDQSQGSRPGEKFDQLVRIMATLRGPGGCPWDREQTFDSIKPYTLEETYEVLDSIDAGDWKGLAEELGDLMLQCVFYAQMASERGLFTIDDTLEAIVRKLVRRHPHVFGGAEARTADEVKHHWERIKSEENREKRTGALLDEVPRSMPALAEAQQIGSKVAKVGFDWPDSGEVFEKLEEELEELRAARQEGDQASVEQELGDLLFVMVNVARWLKVDAEQALRGANAKFRSRFAHVERRLAERGTPLGTASLAQMEEMWEEAKRAR